MSSSEDRPDDSSGESLWSGGDSARKGPEPESGVPRGWLPPTDGPPSQGGWAPPSQPSEEAQRGWTPPSRGAAEQAGSDAPAAAAPGEHDAYATWPGQAADPRTATPAGQAASFWARVGATVVDFFVRLALILAGVLVGALFYTGGDEAGTAGVAAGLIVGALAGLAYAPIMLARTNGRTVGHKATSTRIVRQDGATFTLRDGVVREVAVKWLLFEVVGGFVLIPTIVNYLWPLWDERNEALHDKICKTRVVEE
jgi:uncharacterized RDD family membrane protein YckC